MIFSSSSQAGQDVFAYEVCGRKKDGTFLDVGSYNVVCCNNSYALERVGWRGLMVDVFRDEENLPQRESQFVQANATNLDWLFQLEQAGLPEHLDYLSLDVDADTLATLANMPLRELRFNVISIEHDAYRLGPATRDNMRRVLKTFGYDLVCADVIIPGFGEAEDWWCSPELSDQAKPFRCNGKPYTEIIRALSPK